MSTISIALCTYNGARFLDEQLASLSAQTHLPDELIICDDCSTDNTVQIIEKFSQIAPFPVKIYRNETNLRSTRNFEKAVSLCTGDIIFLCDQDDFWLPKKIELTLREFEKSAEIGMVFSDAELVDESLEPLELHLSDLTYTKKIRDKVTSGEFFEELLRRNYVTGATLAFRSSYRKKILPFPDDIPEMIHDAWIFFILFVWADYSFIEKPLIKYRQHQSQQLGLIVENPLEKLDGAEAYQYSLKLLQSIHERIEKILREFKLRPALFEKFQQIQPTAGRILRETEEAIKHYESRNAVLKEESRRLNLIWTEFRSGRYGKFSSGAMSAIKDLLTIRKSVDFRKVIKKAGSIKNKIKNARTKQNLENTYKKWIAETTEIENENRPKILQQIKASGFQPLISIVMPVYNVEERWLRKAVESVLAQTYTNWEFCIADDNSSDEHIKLILQEYAAKDARIKVVFREQNGHISAASNSALSIATGDYVALLDNDDKLAPDALLYVVKELIDYPETALIYSDEDKIDDNNNRRFDAAFKPDWSGDLLYSLNLVTHLAVFRRNILEKIGGFRLGVEGSQDYDLVLRFIEQIAETQIRHIPRILYHWRAIQGSVALDSNQKNYAHERARDAIREHLKRKGVEAEVTQGYADFHRVKYALPTPHPKVSIVVETENLNEALERNLKSFLLKTSYEDFEILVGTSADNIEAFSKKIRKYDKIGRVKLTKIKSERINKAARLNEIAALAEGEIFIFLDADLIPINEDWLLELASQSYRDEIGAVSGKILYHDGKIRFAGYILGINGIYSRAHYYAHPDNPGVFARLQVINNFSAVSFECLAVKREDFMENGGFDANSFPGDLFDIDFCLRLQAKGKRNLFTPYAEFKQTKQEISEINLTLENKEFITRWASMIEDDPFYNPNLTRNGEPFSLPLPPRRIE